MARRRPQNLELLWAAFDPKRIGDILPGDVFRLVNQYLDLCTRFEGSRIVELGIAEGGSTALISLAAHPQRLVAVDLEEEPLAPLGEFIAKRGLGDVVRPIYGVDQADRVRLADTSWRPHDHHSRRSFRGFVRVGST